MLRASVAGDIASGSRRVYSHAHTRRTFREIRAQVLGVLATARRDAQGQICGAAPRQRRVSAKKVLRRCTSSAPQRTCSALVRGVQPLHRSATLNPAGSRRRSAQISQSVASLLRLVSVRHRLAARGRLLAAGTRGRQLRRGCVRGRQRRSSRQLRWLRGRLVQALLNRQRYSRLFLGQYRRLVRARARRKVGPGRHVRVHARILAVPAEAAGAQVEVDWAGRAQLQRSHHQPEVA
jgi:hypothetical protein